MATKKIYYDLVGNLYPELQDMAAGLEEGDYIGEFELVREFVAKFDNDGMLVIPNKKKGGK